MDMAPGTQAPSSDASMFFLPLVRLSDVPLHAPVEPTGERFASGGDPYVCGGPVDSEQCLDYNSLCSCLENVITLLAGGCECSCYHLGHDVPFVHGCCGEIQGAGCALDSDCQGKCGTRCDDFPDCRLSGSFEEGVRS